MVFATCKKGVTTNRKILVHQCYLSLLKLVKQLIIEILSCLYGSSPHDVDVSRVQFGFDLDTYANPAQRPPATDCQIHLSSSKIQILPPAQCRPSSALSTSSFSPIRVFLTAPRGISVYFSSHGCNHMLLKASKLDVVPHEHCLA